ncbi:Hypothetical protein HVR_LOCUS195 [uncultured virus]|nr:Hypothetical protein HVR_LOCUS195 [uncultured virus]
MSADTIAKNRLQEYFQRQRLPLPQYTSEKIGGADHRPVWQSKVQLSDGSIHLGDPNVSKSKADISAAENALATLFSFSLTTLDTLPSKPVLFSIPNKVLRTAISNTILLVDVENMPNFVDEVLQEINGLDIYAFVGEHHCLSEKIFPPNVIKIVSPSTRSDGTDTCMQVYIGFLLGSTFHNYENYLIATRDHYGSAVVDMITNKLGINSWTPRNAKVVTQVTHIPTSSTI